MKALEDMSVDEIVEVMQTPEAYDYAREILMLSKFVANAKSMMADNIEVSVEQGKMLNVFEMRITGLEAAVAALEV